MLLSTPGFFFWLQPLSKGLLKIFYSLPLTSVNGEIKALLWL